MIAVAHHPFSMAARELGQNTSLEQRQFCRIRRPRFAIQETRCCKTLIGEIAARLTTLIEDAAENEPGNLGDLKSDITGTCERIAERIREERYDGPGGPFSADLSRVLHLVGIFAIPI